MYMNRIAVRGNIWMLQFGNVVPVMHVVDHFADVVEEVCVSPETAAVSFPIRRVQILNHVEAVIFQ